MYAFRLMAAAPLVLLAAPLASASVQQVDPLRFFQGRTETVGSVKIMFHKAYRTHSIGAGRIEPDGSLTLVQRVEDEGRAPHDRRWHVRQTAPDRFSASMSEAVGPVMIERIGNRYRFRFKLKGDLNAEQLLTPLPGGRSALSNTIVKHWGITVATTDAIVRKV